MSVNLILSALQSGSVLIGDCPEAASFDRALLGSPATGYQISLDQKLGHIYEDGLAEWITSSASYSMLEKNLQIQSDIHRTLGELDFLIRDESNGELIHLELAVKFYLAVKSTEGLRLPGPDARDNYYKKLDRLRSHQLTLTKNFREYLPPIYREQPITPQHLILGCCFDHINALTRANPEWMSPTARRGKWLRQGEISQHYLPDTILEIIPKYLWPVSTDDLDRIDLERLDLGVPLQRCTLVKVQGETMPIFITPNGYPE